MNPDPKPKKYINKPYEKWVAERGCFICDQPAEPHHVRRLGFGAGTGTKPHSYVCIPVCRTHHDPDFEKILFDVNDLIINYMVKYIKKKYGKRNLIETLMEFIEEAR